MPILIVVVIILLVLVVGAAWWNTQQRRSEQLRRQFGPEYDRAVERYGERGRAESALQAREERVRRLDIRPLTPAETQHFVDAWRSVQARFVDDPSGAIGDADRLVSEAMQVRGYPMGDFEERAADVSVDHADVVEHYRAAHAIAMRNTREDGSTEELRQAMVHYRALFADVLENKRNETRNETREVRHG
jgi:hypothetical protein